MSSCILYHNISFTIIVIDIPRSIEQAQGASSTRRLLSSVPQEHPFPDIQPKSQKAKDNAGSHSIFDLLIQKHLELVLAEIKTEFCGPWSLPRKTVCHKGLRENLSSSMKPGKRKISPERRYRKNQRRSSNDSQCVDHHSIERPPQIFEPTAIYQNDSDKLATITYSFHKTDAFMSPNSTTILGEISATRSLFIRHAPRFDLILMDPPWPNRSARRKGGYGQAYNKSEIKSLLQSIPIEEHLIDDGYLAVWITNKPIFRELVLELFENLGLVLVEEWIWLKVTTRGEPMCGLGSLWRKPYEILLVGTRTSSVVDVKRRVLVGVADLHSRKPNLKYLYEAILGKKDGNYQALEIFARNTTAGWWSWGNEVLKFQENDNWINPSQEEETEEI